MPCLCSATSAAVCGACRRLSSPSGRSPASKRCNRVALFTIDEAEALLPRITELLLDMQRCKREIDGLRDGLGHAVHASSGNGHVKDEPQLAEQRRRAESFVEQLNEGLAAINELGAELKDLDQGLIDFPYERDGRV